VYYERQVFAIKFKFLAAMMVQGKSKMEAEFPAMKISFNDQEFVDKCLLFLRRTICPTKIFRPEDYNL